MGQSSRVSPIAYDRVCVCCLSESLEIAEAVREGIARQLDG